MSATVPPPYLYFPFLLQLDRDDMPRIFLPIFNCKAEGPDASKSSRRRRVRLQIHGTTCMEMGEKSTQQVQLTLEGHRLQAYNSTSFTLSLSLPSLSLQRPRQKLRRFSGGCGNQILLALALLLRSNLSQL